MRLTKKDKKTLTAMYEKESATPKFRAWVNRRYYELKDKKTIDQRVDEALVDKNLKIEVKDVNDRWVEHEIN